MRAVNRREFLGSLGTAAALSGPLGALLAAAACEPERTAGESEPAPSARHYHRAYREAVPRRVANIPCRGIIWRA